MGPVEQARRWTAQLIGVLMRRETVARVEKGRRGARRLLKPGGEKGRRNGGVRPWGCHAARERHGAWLRPAGGVLTVSRPAVTRTRRARAARRYPDSGALALTWVDPGGSESGEGAERCEWRACACGPA
jgi:hypothetical protein